MSDEPGECPLLIAHRSSLVPRQTKLSMSSFVLHSNTHADPLPDHPRGIRAGGRAAGGDRHVLVSLLAARAGSGVAVGVGSSDPADGSASHFDPRGARAASGR